jgi:prepilin-type processing-associated H-X9-DG protein
MNGWVFTASGMGDASITAPAQTIAGREFGLVNGNASYSASVYMIPNQITLGADASAAGTLMVHNGGMNVPLCDGHVKWFSQNNYQAANATVGNPNSLPLTWPPS